MNSTSFIHTGDLYVDYVNSQNKKHRTYQHYHETYEIYVQLSGTRYIFYDNICCDVKCGNVVVIEPFNVHYSSCSDDDSYERIVVNFSMDMFNSILTDNEIIKLTKKLPKGIINVNEEQTEILKLMFSRIKHYQKSTEIISKKMLAVSVLQFIMLVIECGSNIRRDNSNRISDPISIAVKYINENYQSDITIDELAEIAHMSKYYFCRRFKQITGASPFGFVINIRLTHVHRLLISTDLNIETIAERTGFSSALSMLRSFKKVYGITPREFRKMSNM